MKVYCNFTLRTIGATSLFQKEVKHFLDYELDIEDISYMPVGDIFDNVATILLDKVGKPYNDAFYVIDEFTCSICPNVVAWRLCDSQLGHIITWNNDGEPIRNLDWLFKETEEEKIEQEVWRGQVYESTEAPEEPYIEVEEEFTKALEEEPDEYLPENL